ncbi:MAG: glycosyltransferase family 25 protein [Pseudomonadota bacterium]
MDGGGAIGIGAGVLRLVVSLAARADRRATMAAHLADIGLEAGFHDAVDARTAPATALDSVATRGPWGRIHPHDRACTASHFAAMAAFLKTPARHCLILEDDVFVSPDLPQWLADLSWWPSDADLIKLECWRARRLKLVVGPAVAEPHGRRLHRLHSRHSGGAGYLLSRPAAERILAARPARLPIDHLLFNLNASPLARALTTYQVLPALVRQGNEPPAQAQPRLKTRIPWPEYALQETRRGLLEIARLPRQALVLARGGHFLTPTWAERTLATQPPR